MKPFSLRRLIPAALLVPLASFAAKTSFDIPPSPKRQSTVQLAQSIAARTQPAPLPADLPSPFNPPDFDKPDPSELPPPSKEPNRGGPNVGGNAGPATPQPAAPAGDRAILEIVASKIPATGMVMLGNPARPILMVAGGKRFEVGTSFTVTYDTQEYELEVVAIDRTTFTLRYRGEEITRAIRLTK